MEKNFDFDSVGKRIPYQVPDGFFSSMEQEVSDRISKEALSQPESNPFATRNEPFWKAKRTLLAAAAIIVVLLVMTFHFAIKSETSVSQTDIETAFDNLSTADQAYLLAVYDEDVFLEEQEDI